ncbi:MAG TPA: cobalt ECF transporter T component CbiQ [Anaerolineae bacterium]|nr:cobalt ECF transporter T component CbiQ [Anaerolineae bacterium]
MHIIDQFAYSNRIRRVDPAYKAGLALVIIVLCLALNELPVSVLAIAWMFFLSVQIAGLSVWTFGRILLVEFTFLLLATIGVIVSLSLTDPGSQATWSWSLGPLWFSSSPASLDQGLTLIARSLGCASAMNFLALTTPLVDLIDLLRRLRVPPILIDLMTLIYRFIFVLLESLNRMATAQESRLGYSSYRRGMVSAGLLGSRLFIDAYHRGQRMQLTLDSRAYGGGVLQVLPMTYYRDNKLLSFSLLVVVSLLGVWMVL